MFDETRGIRWIVNFDLPPLEPTGLVFVVWRVFIAEIAVKDVFVAVCPNGRFLALCCVFMFFYHAVSKGDYCWKYYTYRGISA